MLFTFLSLRFLFLAFLNSRRAHSSKTKGLKKIFKLIVLKAKCGKRIKCNKVTLSNSLTMQMR